MEDTERIGRRTGVYAAARLGRRRFTPRTAVGVITALLMIATLYLIFAVAPPMPTWETFSVFSTCTFPSR